MNTIHKPSLIWRIYCAILSTVAFFVSALILVYSFACIPHVFGIIAKGLYLVLYAITCTGISIIVACFLAQFTYDYFVEIKILSKINSVIKSILVILVVCALQFFIMWLIVFGFKQLFSVGFIENYSFLIYCLLFLAGLFSFVALINPVKRWLEDCSKRTDTIRFYLDLPNVKIVDKKNL